MRKRVGRHFSIGVSEAKSSLPELVGFEQPTVLLRHGQPIGAILSIRELNEYETLRAAFADPEVLQSLIDSGRSARRLPLSELGTEAELRALIARRGSSQQSRTASAEPGPDESASGRRPSRAARRR